MKRALIAITCLLSPLLHAEDAPAPITDKCVIALRDVFKVYYHDVEPNPDPACHNNKLMDEKQQSSLNTKMADMKNNCPADLILRMSQALYEDSQKA